MTVEEINNKDFTALYCIVQPQKQLRTFSTAKFTLFEIYCTVLFDTHLSYYSEALFLFNPYIRYIFSLVLQVGLLCTYPGTYLGVGRRLMGGTHDDRQRWSSAAGSVSLFRIHNTGKPL